MSLRRYAAAVVIAGGLAASPASGADPACPNADQAPANATVSELAAGVRCLLNQERAGGQLSPVAGNSRLASAANGHATDMVARHYFAHTSLGGATFVDRIRRAGYLPSMGQWSAGEILAWASGPLATPRGIVDAWMASPEHRQILMDPRYADVGVGVAVGAPEAGADPAITVDADFGRIAGRSRHKRGS
ncbi:MAG: hypothetical protein JWO74_4540 [Solirubrobacterales bacterium]|nr:hypothetical protein [Solirubrobacterales bacterium]